MDEVSFYTNQAFNKLSEGYVNGGIEELKKRYPENYKDMEKDLINNWSISGVKQYCKSMIAGLTQIGYWKSVEQNL